ncbi:hypothetical protein [uncultured Mucilaginibacter sp.]|uniref:hypothetical protein n=1 Tax=uncultured Mucilaginibacter sp. TaxID=797541 RepID=UPI0025F9866A|nr:hypothetical protein [uncultured Mucilaginibacter sp.]
MSVKKEIENMLHNQFGNSGIQGLVDLMQLNYNMHGKPVKVSGFGNEITVDMQGEDMVEQYTLIDRIVKNPGAYSSADVTQAKSLHEQFKNGIAQGKPQSPQDKEMFSNARVTKLTFLIGGLHVTTVNL